MHIIKRQHELADILDRLAYQSDLLSNFSQATIYNYLTEKFLEK